ncbi:MAG: squalene--hopene cyclase [Pedosphaera sp.]|nr:squalene--hopene cyclase [Pedosphaera sp.]
MKRCFQLVLVLLAGVFAGRAGAQELFEGTGEGVPFEVDRMYVKGLQFLVQSQNAQGSWSDGMGSQPAVVGLAILSMLAHGEDPNNGPYAPSIKRGLNFILGAQSKETGYIGSSMYNHGFATLALAEAYGTVNDPRLGLALQEAVKLILNSQVRNSYGAWRYSPESSDADTTVSGANLVALFAARNAGLGVPEEAVRKALQFYGRCRSQDGGFGYTGPEGSNGPRTAIGALVFGLAKQKDSSTFKGAFQFLNRGGNQSDGGYYHYYLYYASQAYFHASVAAWTEWNAANVATLKTSQRGDGGWDGSNGTTFCTASALLSMALNYRYLPIYER